MFRRSLLVGMISLGLVGVLAPAGQAEAAPPGCDKFGDALVNAGVLLTPAGPTLFDVVHKVCQ